jgi:hypothetical protein
MKRNLPITGWKLLLAVGVATLVQAGRTDAQQSAQQMVADTAKADKFAFILFYRQNDMATQRMLQTLQTELKHKPNAAVVSVLISNPADADLVDKYEATRTPLPAVVVVAPNEAVTGVYLRHLTRQDVQSAIVTPGQTECMKAIQDQKLVLLCIQGAPNEPIPTGVQQFQADELYVDRIQLVTIAANDPAEAAFLRELNVNADTAATVTAFMAPPGVLLGKYDADVTHATLADRLVAAGKCCDDPNCNHRRSAGKPKSRR